MPTRTRAWITGYEDAKAGKDRKAPYAEPSLVEAYAAGYDSYKKDN